jgi:signal transduction histidine kinase
MMSHELRTPLSAIIGYQELLSEEISGPINDEQRQQLDRIQSSAAHLRDLINQILSLSRIEAGKEEVETEEVDLARLTREVSLLMQQKAAARGLTLDIEAPEELCTRTDAGKVRQVLLNLLSNAIKFTPEGGIRVTLESDQDAIRLSVLDSGVGIAVEERERIFDVFTQVDQSMTRSVGGSGLGLAVSQRIARLLEGGLELDSEPGAGSTFTLRLPRNPV